MTYYEQFSECSSVNQNVFVTVSGLLLVLLFNKPSPVVVSGCRGPGPPASAAASVCRPSRGVSPGPRRSRRPPPQAGAATTESGGRPAAPACAAAPPADPAKPQPSEMMMTMMCQMVNNSKNMIICAHRQCAMVLLQGFDGCVWVTNVHCVASALCVGQPQQQRMEALVELLRGEIKIMFNKDAEECDRIPRQL